MRQDIWNQFLHSIESEFSRESVDRWLSSLQYVRSDQKNIWLEAANSFQILWFEEHIRPLLPKFFASIGMNSSIQVHIRSLDGPKSQNTKKKSIQNLPGPLSPPFFKKKKKEDLFLNPFQPEFTELDPTATFFSFIETSENRLVIKLLDEVCSQLSSKKIELITSSQSLKPVLKEAERSFSIPNPIYLWGSVGCGKSHLLQATTSRLKQSGLSVIMANSELFTEHVIRSIRAGEMSTFRSVWRNIDVLIVDDIHLFARKHATQEEFFHTFNTLHTAGKQIILTANCPPQQLQQIESRLISRFEWGIVLQVEPLMQKQISSLLSKKALLLNFSLSDKQIEFLSTLFPNNAKSSVRALEALILRTTLSHKNPQSLSLSLIKDLLKDLIIEEEKSALTPKKIITSVADHMGIPYEEIIGKSQSRESVTPRQLSMYLIRKHLKIPYMKIGDIFERDHSTVMSSIRQVEKQISTPGSDIGATLANIEMLLSDG